MSERDDDFLARWSRRKAELRDGGLQKKSEPAHKPGRMRTEAPEPKVSAPADEAAAGGEAEIPLSREASLQDGQAPVPVQDGEGRDAGAQEPEEDDAPENYQPGEFDDVDFDKLNYGSDYSRFMKDGVPEAIRRRALRMLWKSNPILANLDGLNDYDEDFTDAALAVKVLTSNYKPGLGHLTEEERIASYSEEARKAGEQPSEDDSDVEDMDAEDMDAEYMDAEDMDAEDMNGGESGRDPEIASAPPEGDGDGENGGSKS